jgi:MarR family transcriptional repressor of emrRAB
MYHGIRDRRDANLLGATAVAISDRLVAAIGQGRGLSTAAALIHIRQRPGETVHFLARVLGLTHSGAVRLDDRLSNDGLVQRGPGADRRSLALYVTPAGDRAARAALDEREQVLSAALSALKVSEQAQLTELLEKLLARLAGDRWSARHICRLCDFPRCSRDTCPVDQSASEAGY